MDSESLAQVERIVTAVTQSLRQDIVVLRQSTEATAGELRQDMAALRQSTETSAAELRQDIVALRQSTEATAGELRQDIVALRQSQEATAAGLRNEVTTTAEEIKRHTGVLIEGLRHDIQSVAEGFQLHLDHRHAEDREYTDQEFRELRALLTLSYAQLRDRVEGPGSSGRRDDT
jgi:hypothetical protein